MSMPLQKPGKSEQVVGTPDDFFQAVVKRFGGFTWDLAADWSNTKCIFYLDEAQNSLTKDWHKLAPGCNLWLNPPYADIGRWAVKAACEREFGASIFMLVPASVGSSWYSNFVEPYAYVLALSPRLTFVGHKHPYPKDLLLCCYNSWGFSGFETWRWK
jgi:phage N-6-adenine-methyltransferase